MTDLPCPLGRCERGARLRSGLLEDFGYCGNGRVYVVSCECASTHPKSTEGEAKKLWSALCGVAKPAGTGS